MYFPFSEETYKMTDFVKTLSPTPLSLPKQLAITTFKKKTKHFQSFKLYKLLRHETRSFSSITKPV